MIGVYQIHYFREPLMVTTVTFFLAFQLMKIHLHKVVYNMKTEYIINKNEA